MIKKGFGLGYLVDKKLYKTGKKIGIHKGRVAVRALGSFNIKTSHGLIQGISHKHCTKIQCADGYGYLTRNISASDASLPLFLTAINGDVS